MPRHDPILRFPYPGLASRPPDSIVRRGGGRGGGVNSTPSLSLRILWVLVNCLPSGTSHLPETQIAQIAPPPWGWRPRNPRAAAPGRPPNKCTLKEFSTFASGRAGAECLVKILSSDSPTRVWPAAPGFYRPPGRGGGVKSTPSLSLRILWVLVKYLTSKVGSSYLPEIFWFPTTIGNAAPKFLQILRPPRAPQARGAMLGRPRASRASPIVSSIPSTKLSEDETCHHRNMEKKDFGPAQRGDLA